jgi:hypothetical protein
MADVDRMNKMFNDIRPKYDLNLDESTCQWRLKGSWSSLERRNSKESPHEHTTVSPSLL